jgi:hypothetical protein
MVEDKDRRVGIASTGRKSLDRISAAIRERRQLEDQILDVFSRASKAQAMSDEELRLFAAQLDGIVLGFEAYLWNEGGTPEDSAQCVRACKEELNRCFRDDVSEEDNSFPCVPCAECRLAYLACLLACSRGSFGGGGQIYA